MGTFDCLQEDEGTQILGGILLFCVVVLLGICIYVLAFGFPGCVRRPCCKKGGDEETLVKVHPISKNASDVSTSVLTLEEAKEQIRRLEEKNSASVLTLEEAKEQIRRLEEKNRASIRQHREAQQQIRALETENNELKIRLSGVMSDRMRENNPDIVNLNDPFRPNKLAEISSEIYDNEWTDAFNVLEKTDGILETKAIRILLDIVMVTYMMCRTRADQQWKEIVNLIEESDDAAFLRAKQVAQDERKRKAETLFPDVKEAIIHTIGSQHGGRLLDRLNTAGPVQIYLDACISLCCHMVVQCPPSVWYCPGWKHIGLLSTEIGTMHTGERDTVWHCPGQNSYDSELRLTDIGTVNTGDGSTINDTGGNTTRNGTAAAETECGQKIKFEKKLFREYMRAGQYVEYVLWPAMLQYEDGPTMSKGVAQGCS